MNNTLIDDRRIRVDFSQSVAKEWNWYMQRKRYGRGGRRGYTYTHERGGGGGRGGGGNRRKLREEKKYYGGYKQQEN